MAARNSVRVGFDGPEQGVRVEEAGGIVSLILDRPSRKNALTVAMYRLLTAALKEAASNERMSVVRLSSSSSVFCVGNDFGVMLEGSMGEVDGDLFARTAGEFLYALAHFPKPIIAEVGGLAAGAGATMLLHCDIVIAATTACFDFPCTKLGVLPDAGSSVLLPARVGMQRAIDWLLFGERIDVQSAQRLGIVNTVVVREQLTPTVLARADALTKFPQVTLRETKRLLREPLRRELDEAIARELEAISESLRHH